MNKVSAFFQNSWVIGIIGGIISGLIVYLITFILVERRNKSNYEKEIMSANNAVLSVIRPYIADSGIPQADRIDAIANSISRKYKINRKEMASLPEIYEDLILEFMSNLYIPVETKKTAIAELLDSITNYREKENPLAIGESTSADAKKNTVNVVSVIISTLAAGATMASCMLSASSFVEKGVKMAIIPIAIVIIVVIVELVLLAISLYREKRRRGRKVLDDNIRLVNHGRSINEVMDDFKFVDYFDVDRYNE